MVTPTYYPITGGTEVVVRNLAIKLNENGVDTDVMTFNIERKWHSSSKKKIEQIEGVTVYKIPALNWFPLTHSNRITMGINLIPGMFQNELKAYDIIHFHDDLSFPLFSLPFKKPKMFHLHTMNKDFFRRYFLSRTILMHIADLYISLTNIMKADLMELGVLADKIRVLPNGIDVNLFRPFGKKDENLVLFVGRITNEKGVHIVLKSLAYLKSKIHLVIIGPQDWNSEYFNYIMRLIKKENGKRRHEITYLGVLDQSALISWYQKASLIVLPTIKPEAFGIVILEALACETPVVATNLGGVPEVIIEGENGFLVPPNDAIKLAEAMSRLLDNKSLRERFGKAGRKWAMKNFSYEVIISRLTKIYEELFHASN
jgi:glycosyltransferase involved in cell wall biosynthesis